MSKFWLNMSKNSVASTLAIIWSIGGILFFFFAASGLFHATESTITMLSQGMLSICILILGAYFSANMKKPEKESAQ